MMDFTYLIRAGEADHYKIGRSEHPRRRLFDLQTACPLKLTLLAAVPFAGAEEILHRHYANHRSKFGGGGEWFTFTDERTILSHFLAFYIDPVFYESDEAAHVIFPAALSDVEMATLTDSGAFRNLRRKRKKEAPAIRFSTITQRSDIPTGNEVILTDRHLRERFHISATTAWRLRTRQHKPIPHFFVGGQVRYRLSEVEGFFSE